ncbi:hypothetical protein [Pseudomonas sp. NFPP24]|uniref:hypothetical protein n=1 Tax=Pseudomonas sp. NFPP24 TaxID=1566228 RepID=UPI001587C266|nr:hypothetical protein [Pseudomonas sp. NFPP24]
MRALSGTATGSAAARWTGDGKCRCDHQRHAPYLLIAPRSATRLSFDAILKLPSGAASLRFSTVDDNGALRHHRQPL